MMDGRLNKMESPGGSKPGYWSEEDCQCLEYGFCFPNFRLAPGVSSKHIALEKANRSPALR